MRLPDKIRVYPLLVEGIIMGHCTDTQHLTPEQQAFLDRPLADLQIPVRLINALESPDPSCQVPASHTIRDLLSLRKQQLLQLPNFGEKSLDVVYEALARKGFFHKEYRVSEEANEAQRIRKRADTLARKLGFENYDDEEVDL
jgi:DNA-directed RNA polymerase alpha subunit